MKKRHHVVDHIIHLFPNERIVNKKASKLKGKEESFLKGKKKRNSTVASTFVKITVSPMKSLIQ